MQHCSKAQTQPVLSVVTYKHHLYKAHSHKQSYQLFYTIAILTILVHSLEVHYKVTKRLEIVKISVVVCYSHYLYH